MNNVQYKHIFPFNCPTLNVPFPIGKCTLRGTRTPVWEPLVFSVFYSQNILFLNGELALDLMVTYETMVLKI